ncbi:hypothetical protein [Cedecea sp.]|jgi:hypothetical protein|uniref:hypothetical protein n=1 Tax=Cedecea sp. TaxID=1970739 RepID=UPI002F421F6B
MQIVKTSNPKNAHAEGVKIGEFTISNFDVRVIWIDCGNGESEAFDEEDLIEALRAFYRANL